MWARSTSTLLWKLGDKLKPETRLDFEFSTKNGKNRFFRGGFDIYYFQSDIETFPIFFFRQKGWIFFLLPKLFWPKYFFVSENGAKAFCSKIKQFLLLLFDLNFFFTRAREKNRHGFFCFCLIFMLLQILNVLASCFLFIVGPIYLFIVVLACH